ncbi:hypothetical protein SNE40_023292 [Patella caerulea]|uniref:PEHE domain-containing protein n=1 Tax=Patella caerulea TaxID=87958 RepID=A0AAN8G6Y3_PATCE
MKSEYIGDGRNRTEGRQYLQRRRLTKPVHYKNGDFDSDLALAMQESLKLARQKETELNLKDIENRVLPNGTVLDVIPATKMADKINNSGDAGNQECKDLKNLLLLHVELIQHQGDLLAKRDKEVKDLKTEKHALECRLERMERRMSLLKQKEEFQEAAVVKETHDVTPTKSVEKSLKRKSTTCLGSPTPSKHPARRMTKTPSIPSRAKTDKPKKHSDTSHAAMETENTETPVSKYKQLHNQLIEDDNSFLNTDTIYHVVESQLRSRNVEILDASKIQSGVQSQIEIEVPNWRIIKYTNLWQMEGTENLEDDTIIKRHQKPELEEKRRKRWDMQRMREQKAAMKLRVRENSSSTDHNIETSQDIDTFLPILDDITHIEVRDKLPVIAFGHPLPGLTQQDFDLPWECDKTLVNKRHTASRSRRK